MLIVAIVFFALAMLFGLILFSYVLQDKKIPRVLALTHGSLAITGIILLVIYAVTHAPSPMTAMILFILAAIGGAILFYKDLTGKPIPKWFALAHGFLAFAAFIFLVIFTLVTKTS